MLIDMTYDILIKKYMRQSSGNRDSNYNTGVSMSRKRYTGAYDYCVNYHVSSSILNGEKCEFVYYSKNLFK